ncbi:hypothetical protein [Marinifilum breve]|nr:hypothetical protein [Marinifilum breve]
MKYILLGLYVVLTLVLPLTLVLFVMDTDPTMTSYFLISIIIGWVMQTVFLIPPVLVVNTLLGAKIKLNTKKAIDAEYEHLTEDERNTLSYSILEQMYGKLPSAEMEDGSEGFKIETGKDAIRLKRTIEYIVREIQPNNEEISELLENNASFYKEEMKRVFFGAKAVMVVMIIALVIITLSQNEIGGVIAMLLMGGFYITFYYYSAKRPIYLLRKDEEKGKVFDSSLLSQSIKSIWGPGKYKTRHYDVNDGRVSRNYGREAEDSIMNLVIKLIATVITSIIALFLSPIYIFYYFCSNYWGNCLNPFKNTEKWMKEEYDFDYSKKLTEEIMAEVN